MSQLGFEGWSWHPEGGDPTRHRAAPPQRMIWGKMSTVPRLRNPVVPQIFDGKLAGDEKEQTGAAAWTELPGIALGDGSQMPKSKECLNAITQYKNPGKANQQQRSSEQQQPWWSVQCRRAPRSWGCSSWPKWGHRYVFIWKKCLELDITTCDRCCMHVVPPIKNVTRSSHCSSMG